MNEFTIPQEKKEAVSRGLREAFGVSTWDEIRELEESRGNPVFRMVVGGSAYLLRINMRAGDLTRHFGCVEAAAEAGLAPRVLYASAEDRVSITDFVEAVPFPADEARRRIPAALRTVHGLRAFPNAPDHLNTTCTFLLGKGPAAKGFVERFRSGSVVREEEKEQVFSRYEEMVEAYRRLKPDMVSSHNDLFKPDNMMFDGERLWMVDWEAAFLNDRYVDLAAAANLVVADDAEERVFLEEYFGKKPDAYQRARFYVMRQLTHMFYVMAFLSMGKAIDWTEPVAGFAEFQRRFWSGEVKLTDNGSKALFGRVHWEQLLRNVGQARFGEALRTLTTPIYNR